ncbi:hypothetical protein OSTOST_06573 [Ostertagia ostertagi]
MQKITECSGLHGKLHSILFQLDGCGHKQRVMVPQIYSIDAFVVPVGSLLEVADVLAKEATKLEEDLLTIVASSPGWLK